MGLIEYFAGRGELITVLLGFFSVFVILFLIFPFRAYARGWVATRLGDDTPESSGMLTLNPLVHIDPMGALCMCLCSIGWSKYMPISLNRCRKVTIRKAAVLIALTGPLSLIILALVLVIICKVLLLVVPPSEMLDYIRAGLYNAALISTYLAVLNLIPVPSFDGYVLIQGLLPRKTAIAMEQNSRIINFIVFVLLVSGALSYPLGIVSSGIMWLLDLMTIWLG